jgi:hypothetical protein
MTVITFAHSCGNPVVCVKPAGSDQLGDFGIHERIILKFILKK